MNKCYYIAELNLPSNSAYAVHVFQMCNALAKARKKVVLLIPYVKKNLLNKIKKEYGIKYNFEIMSTNSAFNTHNVLLSENRNLVSIIKLI